MTDAFLMQEEIGRLLVALGEIHRGELGATEPRHLELVFEIELVAVK